MDSTQIWLFTVLGIAGAALIWRNKRQYDRTNEHGVQRHGSYWKKLKGDSFDAILLCLGYIGLFASVVLLIAFDPSLLIWFFVVGAIVYWAKVRRDPRP